MGSVSPWRPTISLGVYPEGLEINRRLAYCRPTNHSKAYSFFSPQKGESKTMTTKNFEDQCSDITQEFIIQIPCRLAERIEAHAKEQKSNIDLVVIEALDAYLRNQ